MASRRTSKRKLNTQIDNEISESSTAERKKHIKIDDDGEKEKASLSTLSPVVVFAHGAGAPSSSDWMIRWKDMLGKALHAVEVVTFDYAYMAGGKRRAPPKAEKLVDYHSDIVKKTAAKYPGHPLILAGKSMGSRISCMVASEIDSGVSAVICLGYPLKGINGVIRDEILFELAVPTMFVQGSKDGLCPLEKLEAVRGKMKCSNLLYVIDGGDHSFKITKKHQQSNGSTQQEAEDLALLAISAFISGSLGGLHIYMEAIAMLSTQTWYFLLLTPMDKRPRKQAKRGSTSSEEVNSMEWEPIEMTEQEEDLINRMHRLVGDRWDLIAGRIPGRRLEEVERFWIMKHAECFNRERSRNKENVSKQNSC